MDSVSESDPDLPGSVSSVQEKNTAQMNTDNERGVGCGCVTKQTNITAVISDDKREETKYSIESNIAERKVLPTATAVGAQGKESMGGDKLPPTISVCFANNSSEEEDRRKRSLGPNERSIEDEHQEVEEV